MSRKTIVHEIIDIQENEHQINIQQPLISDLAKQCTTLFGWLSQQNTQQFYEQIWKNQTIELAATKFPELNHDQLVRLVDRDWKVMTLETKNKICEKYKQKSQENLQQSFKQFGQQLLAIKQSLKNDKIDKQSS